MPPRMPTPPRNVQSPVAPASTARAAPSFLMPPRWTTGRPETPPPTPSPLEMTTAMGIVPPRVQFRPNTLCHRCGRQRGGLGGPRGDGMMTTLVVGPGCNPHCESCLSRQRRRGCSSPGSSAPWRSLTASSKGQRTCCVCSSGRRSMSIARRLSPGDATALQAVVPPPSSRSRGVTAAASDRSPSPSSPSTTMTGVSQ